MACDKDSLFRAPESTRPAFRVQRFFPGVDPNTSRQLVDMQTSILRALGDAIQRPRFAEVKTTNYSASPDEFVRLAPEGDRVITLEQPRRENQGKETRLMIEDLSRGTLTIQAIDGTVDKLPFVTATQPGLIVATSNGVDNYSLTLFVGTGTDAPVGQVDGNTVRGNPQATPQLEVPIPLGLHTVLLRGAGNLVARSLQTFFGARLTYDESSNSVSADDQLADLSADNGVTKELNNFREEDHQAQAVKVNATDAIARPLPLPFGPHTFFANVGSGIVARTLQAFYGSGITYDEGSGTVSVDAIDVGLENSNEGLTDDGTTVGIATDGVTTPKIANSNVTLPKIANVGGNRLIGNSTGVTGVLQELATFTHSFYFRGANNLAVRGFSAMFGAGLSYSNATEQVTNSDPGSGVDADRNLDRSTGDIGMAGIDQHSFYARQSAGNGTPNVGTCGANQVLARPGTGVIQGTQVLTDMIANLAVVTGKIANLAVTGAKIANQAVDFSKIINLNSNSIMGRFQGTNGEGSSLSFATHSFAAREGGTIFNKTLASLGGNNITYNNGTGQLDGADPGDPVPANTNATITRNSVGTLIASSMGGNSVIIRSNNGSPSAFNFATTQVLRSVGGIAGLGQLATDHLGNAIVTAAKILTSDAFTWGGAHSFGSQIFLTANQSTTINAAAQVVAVAGFVNTLKLTPLDDSADALAGLTGGSNGRKITIMNQSSTQDLFILPNNGGAGTNGFAAATDQQYVIHKGGAGIVQYNSSNSRWHVHCTSASVIG